MARKAAVSSEKAKAKTPAPAKGELSDADLDRMAGGTIKQNPQGYINPDGSINKST